MVSDIYTQLAAKLDQFPQGFPETKSGVEIEILKWIFNPADATIAFALPQEPEPAASIATRIGKTASETECLLEAMLARKQLFCFVVSGVACYFLPPFFPGFHEYQVYRPDKSEGERQHYARLFEDYYPQFVKTAGGHAPGLTRVVPVSTAVEPDLKIHRLDDVVNMLRDAKSINLALCPCREEKALQGHPCHHSREVCLTFSNQPDLLAKWGAGRMISNAEAIEVAKKAEQEGLVHTTYNADDGSISFLCACCPCCSNFLSGLAKHKAPHLVTQSNFVAHIDETTCTECGVCADERCPVKAIQRDDDGYRVLPLRCIGCGVCVSTCPSGSLSLVVRPLADQEIPAASHMDWAIKRIENRNR